jgi:hypothetical protein
LIDFSGKLFFWFHEKNYFAVISRYRSTMSPLLELSLGSGARDISRYWYTGEGEYFPQTGIFPGNLIHTAQRSGWAACR